MQAVLPPQAPLALAPRTNLDFSIYRPRDAARKLGINEDSVTRYLRLRPNLFPRRAGDWHEWSREEFERVLQVLKSLCPKVRRVMLRPA